jgi:hypothetical protein
MPVKCPWTVRPRLQRLGHSVPWDEAFLGRNIPSWADKPSLIFGQKGRNVLDIFCMDVLSFLTNQYNFFKYNIFEIITYALMTVCNASVHDFFHKTDQTNDTAVHITAVLMAPLCMSQRCQ